VKKKTLPHLLYMGKWSSFVIRIPRGRILLYYEGSPNPLFEWEHPELIKAFLPIYYYYNSEKGYAIGVAFDCTSSIYLLYAFAVNFEMIFFIFFINDSMVIQDVT